MPFMVHLRSRLLVQHFSLDLLGCHLGLCVLPFDAYVMRMSMVVHAYVELMFVMYHGECYVRMNAMHEYAYVYV